ncbi:coproporphyrinogen dehydrogenase HemZ [Tepidibacter formicigenes]|jgi:oxygen-independent coproporphyrinogen-3 oxidase|uniref:Oxygen-independent coproporphyrinogen-3 oxidase n=1 Tax=Tepidibacter formicigenes DSM 15518 TaxID=1123349 RepID=A0A1M6MVF4_9FIRM|nr:coproporphyrinogen dehydrogenase HemZ [Tepidibacter formicigenes]SHJ87396.1 oxygen-independent coproporphyrinogen-3 oxidase [Tepidibacter formicigenes DSM 15518]
MINVFLKNHDYKYEVGELLKLFTSQFNFVDNDLNKGKLLINDISIENDLVTSKTYFYENNNLKFTLEERDTIEGLDEKKIKKESKIVIKRSIFKVLTKIYKSYVPWGILTGIRPTKIVHELLDENKSKKEIDNILNNKYQMDESKINLAYDIANVERKFIYPPDKNKIALYVSIPFCPTRCVYCSFPSNTIKQWGHLKGDYLNALIKEIKGVGTLVKKLNKEIESVYIGGGTPTTLDEKELNILIDSLYENFDLTNIKEFTVEAGRPDTITKEKLKVLKDKNISRISINPQTMNESTLLEIGRSHKVEDIVNCFNMARALGFDNINMDIILGLPKETPNMVENTLKQISKLSPESLTVHTMAIKRASKLKENIQEYELSQYMDMVKMIDISMDYAQKMGLNPYYMYRQKHMLGNLENIGYSKKGFECIYNIQIMEEKQSIFALGAGANSKIVYLDENRIERVPNVKNIEHYIKRVDEMIKKKEEEVL